MRVLALACQIQHCYRPSLVQVPLEVALGVASGVVPVAVSAV